MVAPVKSAESNDGLSDDVTKEAIRHALLDVHTCLPGIITSFNPESQTATVKIALKKNLNGVISEVPELPEVPVVFPRGGGYVLTFPIQPGDGCMVHFSERSIDNWYLDGGMADPGDNRMFDLSDAICVPGLVSAGEKIPEYSPDDVNLRNLDGTARVGINPGGDIEYTNPGGSVKLSASGVFEINATTIKLNGNVESTGTFTNNGTDISSTHRHSGVQTGGGNTNVPI